MVVNVPGKFYEQWFSKSPTNKKAVKFHIEGMLGAPMIVIVRRGGRSW